MGQILLLGQSVSILCIAFACFISIELASIAYVAYLILVPYEKVNILGHDFGANVISALLLSALIYRKKLRSLVPIYPFLVLFAILGIAVAFSDRDVPISYQLNMLRVDAMSTIIPPLVIWNCATSNPLYLKRLITTSCICIIIAGLYGFYLANLGGRNPYIEALSAANGLNEDAATTYANKLTESRLSFTNAAKIQATMVHPMRWALLLSLTLIGASINLGKKKSTIGALIIFLISAGNLLISGVRSGAAAVATGLGYLYGRRKPVYFCLGVAVIAIIGFAGLKWQQSDAVNNVVSQSSNKQGSSVEMRWMQISAALQEINSCAIGGHGYKWTVYYIDHYGAHSEMLAFESLLIAVLCNSGILGIIGWVMFGCSTLYINRRSIQEPKKVVEQDAILFAYLCYTIMTGDYDYMPVFAIVSTIMLAERRTIIGRFQS